MRRRPLASAGLVLLLGIVIAAIVGLREERRRDRLEEEGRSLLAVGVGVAPELHDIEAAEALAMLEAAGRSVSESHAALRHEAQALVHLQAGDLIFAEGALTSARHHGGWTVRRRVLAAAIQRARGNREGARAHVRAALGEAPDAPRALLLEADLALDAGDGQAALRALDRLASLTPEVAAVHNRRGLALEALGRVDAAEVALRQAIALGETHHDAWINLARLRRGAGDLAEARSAFEAARHLAPGDADAHLGLGLVALAGDHIESARTSLQRAQELAPEDPTVASALGDLARRAGEVDAAIASYREGLRRTDEAADTSALWVRLGNALTQKRDFDAAVRAFSEAIDARPRLAAAHNGLGTALGHRGEPGDQEAAREALLRAQELDPQDPRPLMNLALLRRGSGDVAGAREALEGALARDGSSRLRASARDLLRSLPAR